MPTHKNPFERILEVLFVIFLVAAGAVGLYADFRHRFWDPSAPDFASKLTLSIVALLALALGLERFARFNRIDKQFDNIAGLLRQTLSTRLLKDDEVVGEAERLVAFATESIKVLLYEEEATDSPTLSEEIAVRLQACPRLEFDLVLVSNRATENDEYFKIHRNRFQAYVSRGVDNRFHRYIFDSTKPIGFDLLIVDEKHLGLQFSTIPKTLEQNKPLAILLWDQPNTVREIDKWFSNTFLRPDSPVIKYETAEELWWKDNTANSSPST